MPVLALDAGTTSTRAMVFANDGAVLAHLGMSGQMLVAAPGRPDEKHLRIRVVFADEGPELRFVDQRTFGGLSVHPLMPAAGGAFVCIGSRLGMVGKPEEVMYSAAKGGLIMLAKGAAIEWAPRNIRVNVVAAGLTATPVIEASFQRRPDPEAYRREREEQIPLHRLATPAEIADAVLFLASPESSYITGAVLPVDGGYTAF